MTSHPMASGSFAHASVASCWPSLKRRLSPCPDLEQKVEALLSTLSLREKVGQMIQAEIRSVTPEQVQEYRLGSILSGGGAFPGNDKHASVEDWQALADAHYEASMAPRAGGPAIPVLWGVDAVHGHNNLFG
ncbi:MAG: glycoside hydrolase family 3 N-terminal domain-containing protein, partial [Pseudomonadales bacterium]